jgi:hypothetical protein
MLPAKEALEKIQLTFKAYIGTICQVSFNQHSATGTLASIELTPLNKLENKPDKKMLNDKLVSPKIISFNFENDTFSLDIVLDDLDDIRLGTHNRVLVMGDIEIAITRVSTIVEVDHM